TASVFAASIYRDSSNYEGSYKSKSYVQPRLCLGTGGLHADPPPSCLNCALCTIQPPAHRPRPLRKPLVDIQNGKLQLRCARAEGSCSSREQLTRFCPIEEVLNVRSAIYCIAGCPALVSCFH